MEDISYVIFKGSKHFFQRLLKKDFGHVTVLKRDKYNWYKFEPFNDYLRLDILPYAATSMKPIDNYLLEDGVKIIKVIREVKNRQIFSVSFFHFMNCVSVCKYILGIKNLCLTPYRLFRWLKSSVGKQGIIEIEIFNEV